MTPLNTLLLRLFDNTRLSVFKSCPRKYLLEHIYDLRPSMKSAALIFGGAWHEGMDVIWREHAAKKADFPSVVAEAYAAFCRHWIEAGMPPPDEIDPDEMERMLPRIPQVAEEMFWNYLEARQYIFKDPSFKLIAIEQPFAVPLDPNDNSLFYVGRLDKTFEFRRQIIVGEHKTTTSYRKALGKGGVPFRSDFLDSFSPNSQIDGYLYASRQLYGAKATSVWVDAALVHKTVHDGFTFIPVDRQFAQLDAWLWETMHWVDQVESNIAVLNERSADAASTRYLAAFAKNTGNCSSYGGCPMMDICKTIANPATLTEVPLGYRVESWSPFQIVKLQELGFEPVNEVRHKKKWPAPSQD
jgi:hypothetical protein